MAHDVIVHPQLGTIRGRGLPGYRTWVTDPIKIGALGYRASVSLSTKNDEPTDQELALMLSVAEASDEFKALVARHLFQQYMEFERSAYRKQIGDPRYTRVLTESDVPELRQPSEIWHLITGLVGVYVQYTEGLVDVAYLFRTTFDTDHDFQIRFQNGKVHEMGMDG